MPVSGHLPPNPTPPPGRKRPADPDGLAGLEKGLRKLRLDKSGGPAGTDGPGDAVPSAPATGTREAAPKRKREESPAREASPLPAAPGSPSPLHPDAAAPDRSKRGRSGSEGGGLYAKAEVERTGSLAFEYRDGTRRIDHPDDSIVHKHRDGSVSVTFGHGVIVNATRDGVTLSFPDGAFIEKHSLGTRMLPPMPGMSNAIRGATIEHLDGGHKVRIRFSDRVVTHDSEGATTTRKHLPPDTPPTAPNRFETTADGRHRAWRED